MTNLPSQLPRASAFVSRLQFIKLGLATLSAVWLGILLQFRFFPDNNATQEAQPVSFPLSDLPVGGSKTITYAGNSALVIRTPEGLRAFSLICTHLACTVQWQADKKEFYCPCHDGRFDEFGDVLAGPPPIPLEQINIRLEGNMVTVGEV